MFGWSETTPGALTRDYWGLGANACLPRSVGTAMSGILAGTRVASTRGWRTIEAISAGDRVLTFDAGLQPVTAVERAPLWPGRGACPQALWPVEVPAGALGNRDLMYLAPDQSVLIESDTAEALLGDPFALIPARVLDGVRGMCRVPPPNEAQVVTLRFAAEQIVFANSGAMFHCTASGDLLAAATGPNQPVYPVLPPDTAKALADAMIRASAPHPT
ncbi:Hint domain-containing protein [Rhodobacteraceae bacterium KMM 6894]|nr:Hint domain-containing protein [Rhodobacteraceae bacterium KMM 6894]